MNERIKQLAEQCYETGPLGKDGWPEYSRLNEQKFAELIVFECVDIAGKEDFDVMMKEGYPCSQTAKKIKEHFGVEE